MGVLTSKAVWSASIALSVVVSDLVRTSSWDIIKIKEMNTRYAWAIGQ